MLLYCNDLDSEVSALAQQVGVKFVPLPFPTCPGVVRHPKDSTPEGLYLFEGPPCELISSSPTSWKCLISHRSPPLPPSLSIRAKVKRAKLWQDRHPACFLPVAWAFCAAVSAKWSGGKAAGGGRRGGGEGGVSAGGATGADGQMRRARPPSTYSILALLAAFLDRVGDQRLMTPCFHHSISINGVHHFYVFPTPIERRHQPYRIITRS